MATNEEIISEIKGWIYCFFVSVFMALAAFSNNLLSAGIFYFLSIIFYILNLNEWGSDDVDRRNLMLITISLANFFAGLYSNVVSMLFFSGSAFWILLLIILWWKERKA